MSTLEIALGGLLARLAALRVSHAIVGGLAVSARTEPRFTRDADVCVPVHDDHEAEELIGFLQGNGYRVLALVEHDRAGRLASVRLAAPPPGGEDVVLDLLFASSGVEPEVVASAQEIELFEGLRVPVASVAALIALKVLARDDARRPQDRVDLAALLRVASDEDVEETRRLLGLIGERGYARGRDLAAAFRELRAELAG